MDSVKGSLVAVVSCCSSSPHLRVINSVLSKWTAMATVTTHGDKDNDDPDDDWDDDDGDDDDVDYNDSHT